ncbi:probable ATP-dependent RNA helicase DDX20 [Trichomycterus rosablanca]|uniref:probable ATP-dependent RNA helicase DDX20 n=1 Tax=Trichomycterus rosablanca TaxID=2290929 RepID=UPI002F34F46F
MATCMKKAAHEIDCRQRTDDVVLSGGVEFSSLLLSKPVLEGLASSGFHRPSPIQLKAIPLGRCGLDLIVQAKSGTGKTCVFSTIALDSLVLDNLSTQVLVLAPTREIAVQIHSVVMAIGSAMEGLACHVFIGGRPVSQDKLHLKKCHIAIGSPGRIKQLIEMGALLTASIRLFVLDEADKLLEEGSFQEQMNWIFSSLPVNKQMLALSATYPESLAQQLCRYMREPTFVRLNPTDPGLLGLKQYYKLVQAHPLPHKIFEEKVQNLLELFSKIPFNQALVFSNLHSRAQHLADVLSSKGLPAVCISGGLSQEQRLEAMSKLKQYQCRVLISTDLTSRGIDAEKVNLVINLDVPQDWETYMHRIGRAGRFGTLGVAVTYCCHGEEENKMMAIAQKCSLTINPLPDPIPAGLMEEPCDWNVIVQPSSKSDLAHSLGFKVEGKQAKSERNLSKEPHPTNKIQEMTKLSGPAKTQQSSKDRNKSKNPAPLPEAGSAVTAPNAPNVEPRSAPTRKELEEALPKIPPLPSFKPRVMKPVSFADAVADFENFMTAGPGRSVEIIRQYGGRNEETTIISETQINHTDFKLYTYAASTESYSKPEENVSDRKAHSSWNSVDSPTHPAPSRYTDSASSTESESDMETEQKTDASASSSVTSATQPNQVPLNIAKTSRKVITTSHSAKFRRNPDKPQIKTHSHYQHHLRSAPDGKRSGRMARAEHTSCRTQRPKEEVEEEEEDDDDDDDDDGQDYWRACYRAWQEYYSSLGSAHYNHLHYNFMAAYRMNAVYMMEMMKP